MNNRGLEDIIEKHWRNMETCLFSFETLTGITSDASQDNISDISVPADQVGIAPFGSSTVQCSMDNSVGLIDFQPSFQAQCRPKISSLTAQSWKRNLTSKPDTTKHSKHRSKTGLLLPEQYMKEAYCQLEINYRFKPHLREAQMHALAIVVELPYDRVRTFYEQKQSQTSSYVSSNSHVPRVPNPAKCHGGSDSSSSGVVDSACGRYQSDSGASLQTSEQNAIPRAINLSNRIREPS
jgi:hypothetical protein